MKKYFFILFSLFISIQTFSAVKWNLQVTDPDFELKNYDLPKNKFKPFLPKTSWRCEALPTEKKNSLEIRELFCDYSIEKVGTLRSAISCGANKKNSELLIDLYDEKKDLLYKLRLSCQFIE
tara:strand:- start:22416 stop:22781 length:366 start_codon:yes stop_codon:yes gene_type:complete